MLRQEGHVVELEHRQSLPENGGVLEDEEVRNEVKGENSESSKVRMRGFACF